MVRYLSDLIGNKELDTWKEKDNILITTQTGTGKSYFIMNTLLEYARENEKTILLLVPRLSIKKQFDNMLSSLTQNIVIQTYQWLEKRLLKESNDLFFDYIVCDEAHYFVHESDFNKNTWYSWKWVQRQNSVRIFMSATPDSLQALLSNAKIVRHSSLEKVTAVEKIRYFPVFHGNERYRYIDEQLQQLVLTGEKAIIFMGSLPQGAELYRKYKEHSTFFCSDSQYDYLHLRSDEKIETLLNEGTMIEQFLFTTSVLEFGVTIKDKELTHIFYDGYFVDTMIQSVGRKRQATPDDKITLHLPIPDKRSINGSMQTAKKSLEPIKKYLSESDEEAIFNNITEKYDSLEVAKITGVSLRLDEDNNLKLDVNPLSAIKLLNTIKESKGIIDAIDSNIFFETYAKVFNAKSWESVIELQELQRINQTLEQFLGKSLYEKEDKDLLVESLDLRVNRRIVKSVSKINEILEQRGVHYKVISKRDLKRKIDIGDIVIDNPFFKKTYWTVKEFIVKKEID